MKQKGFILIASLFFIVILTLIAISMFGGFTADESMSANYREKARSLDAVQTALNYSALWLGQPGNTYTGDWITGTNCSTVSATPVICSNTLANPSTPNLWSSYVSYLPTGLTVDALGGMNTYASQPSYYIQYLGQTSATTALYMVTATAQGGNATATAVVQVVYQVTATSRNIGGG